MLFHFVQEAFFFCIFLIVAGLQWWGAVPIQEISSRSWIGCLTLKASACNNILVDCKCLILHAVHIVQHVLLHKLGLLILGAHYWLLGLPQWRLGVCEFVQLSNLMLCRQLPNDLVAMMTLFLQKKKTPILVTWISTQWQDQHRANSAKLILKMHNIVDFEGSLDPSYVTRQWYTTY